MDKALALTLERLRAVSFDAAPISNAPEEVKQERECGQGASPRATPAADRQRLARGTETVAPSETQVGAEYCTRDARPRDMGSSARNG